MKLSNKDYAQIIVAAVNKNINVKELATSLLNDLIRNKKLKDLEEIIHLAKTLETSNNNVMIVNVISAQKTTEDDLEDISAHLKQKYKKEIQFEEKIDESIGAGVIIEFNGSYYNLSLKDKIRKLKKAVSQ
jgi:F-type H+-transporting ATPase subunit delta